MGHPVYIIGSSDFTFQCLLILLQGLVALKVYEDQIFTEILYFEIKINSMRLCFKNISFFLEVDVNLFQMRHPVYFFIFRYCLLFQKHFV